MEKLRVIVRVLDTDLDGNKKIYNSLRKIKGISFMMSNFICNSLSLDKTRKVGTLTEKEVETIENLVKNPKNIPSWLVNRRKDYDSGEDVHLVSSKLKLRKEFDLKRLKKIKSYRGLRHAIGLPVRGQRTRGHFRKGRAVGVQKKKLQQQKKPKPSSGGSKKK
jgi:small subunit ribosomal protein S13